MFMSERDDFQACLDALQAATLDASAWPESSATLDEACGTVGSGLVLGIGEGDELQAQFAGVYWGGERRTDLEDEYLNGYYAEDERIPRFRRLAFNRVVPLVDLYTPEELKSSAVFNDFLCRRAKGDSGLNVRLAGPEGCSHAAWILGDPVGSTTWEPERLAMVERLAPHVSQYMAVRSTLAAAEVLGSSMAHLLESWRIAVLLLDRKGKILEANQRAREALRLGVRISDQGGFLAAGWSADRGVFEERLAAALPGCHGPGTAQSIGFRAGSSGSRVVIHISPVRQPSQDWCGLSVAAFVLIAEPNRRSRIRPEQVAALMKLTPAESRVAAALGEGRTVRDIARATDRQESSVYWHLRQIYGKLGISRQSDLVSLVLAVAEFPPVD